MSEKLVEMQIDLFYIKEEVSGGIINGSPLRLDLLLHTNQKVRQIGFGAEATGFEFKLCLEAINFKKRL